MTPINVIGLEFAGVGEQPSWGVRGRRAMSVPIQVTFQAMWPTDEVMMLVQQEAYDLQSSIGKIEECHAIVEQPRRGKGKGRKYRVELTVEGHAHELAIKVTAEHSRLPTAVTRAFRAVNRKIANRETDKDVQAA